MGDRFDELSKALASGVSRRKAMLGVLGGVVAAAIGRALPPEALAGNDPLNPCNNACREFCASFSTETLQKKCCRKSLRRDKNDKRPGNRGVCFVCGPRKTNKNAGMIKCGDVCCPEDNCIAGSGGQVCISRAVAP